MKKTGRNLQRLQGFTLLEMLVAMAVSVLLMLILAEILSVTTKTISNSRELMNVDDQVRLIFGRMASDFAGMLRRTDVDTIFSRESGDGADDKLFFYSAASGSSSYETAVQNPVSLVGYCITGDAQKTPINSTLNANLLQDLHRLGRGLSWSGTAGVDNMVFLTFSSYQPGPNEASTLNGHWSTTIGPAGSGAFPASAYIPPPATSSPTDTPPSDAAYHVLGDQVIRFEYCFLLKDGTYSNYPAINFTSTGGASYGSALGTSFITPPGVNDDSANTAGHGYFCVGSRWFDCAAGRAYICTNATARAAVWGGLGTQDIAALIVALVLVDRDSRKMVSSVGAWQSLPRRFPDPQDSDLSDPHPLLMKQKWQGVLDQLYVTGIDGLPQSVLAHTKIYQRFFYLNALAP